MAGGRAAAATGEREDERSQVQGGICVCVNANGGGLLFFPKHEPIDLWLNVSQKNENTNQGQTVRLRFCHRCGVVYMDEHKQDLDLGAAGPGPQLSLVKPPK